MLIILLKRRHVEVLSPRLVGRVPLGQKLMHGFFGALHRLILVLEVFLNAFNKPANL